MRILSSFIAIFVIANFSWAVAQTPDSTKSPSAVVSDSNKAAVPKPQLYNFEDKKTALECGWIGVTDSVMNGISKVALSLAPEGASGTKQSLKMEGSVIAGQNPYVMFAGCASRFGGGNDTYDVTGFKGIKFWAKGDGNTYRIDLPAAAVTDYMFHSFPFTPPAGEWKEIKVPFIGLKQMPYGKKVAWTGTDVVGVQFFTVGGPIEKFSLQVDEIEFYK